MAGKAGGEVDSTVPLPVRRVERSPYAALPDDQWPLTIPAVAALLREGIDLGPGTVLVGENGAGAARWGYFLRAETLHGHFTYLEGVAGPKDPAFHDLSHGESLLAMLQTRRSAGDGFFVLDEPLD